MVSPDTLRALAFFRDLPEEELGRIAAISTQRTCASGHTLFEEGGRVKSLFILVGGLVSFRQQQKEGGEDAAMGTISEAGDVFGIAAVVGNEHLYPHSARCLEESEIIEVDGPGLRALCEENVHLANHVLRRLTEVMAQRLSATREQLRSRVRPGLISHG